MRRVRVSVIGLILTLPTTAQPQQAETYTYDVHGRLTGVTRINGTSSQTTTYGLDKADNRTSRNVSTLSSAKPGAGTEEMQEAAPDVIQSDKSRQSGGSTVTATDAPSGGAL